MLHFNRSFIIKTLGIGACFLLLEGCAAVVAGTAATGVVVAQDKRTTGTVVEDKNIQLKAMHAIQKVHAEDETVHVSVACYNGHVLLIGQVPSRHLRHEIENAVSKISKVIKIYNEITIGEPTSLKTRSNDSWITTKVKSEMTLTKNFNSTHIKVVTENGVVFLMGIVNADEEDIAVDIARHTKGVKKVVKVFEYEPA